MSGNGTHTLVPIDYPNEEESTALIKQVLESLDAKYSNQHVKVDTQFNKQVLKLYGTLAVKGSHTPEAPYRRAKIELPDTSPKPFDLRQLKDLLPLVQPKPKGQATKPVNGNYQLDMEAYLSANGLEVSKTNPQAEMHGESGTRWTLKSCPFNPDHAEAAVSQSQSGKLGFHCFHDSCQGNDWQAFKAKVGDPKPFSNYREIPIKQKCEGSRESYSTAQLPKTDAFFRDILIGLNGENLLWCDTLGKWLIWDKSRWKFDETRRLLKIVDELVDHFLQLAHRAIDPNKRSGYVELAQKCGAQARQKSIAEMLKPQLPVTVDQLDQQHTLLNVRNGAVDLTTGEILAHSQGYHITKQAHASYKPDSGCSRWIQFLDEIMGGNIELIQFLQCAIGYSLFGLTTEHYLFVLHGTGRNGKSTFLDVLMEILGDYAMPSAPDLLMQKRNDTHPTELAELRGLRLVCCIETEQNRSLRESLIKRLTGGDQLKARYLHQDFFSFKPTHTLFLATNRVPEVRGTDTGIWSRLRLIPFEVSFEGREEKNLKTTLVAEADGILSWAVQGAIEWYKHGLTFPDAVIQASRGWREDADLLGRFIDEKCITAELFEVKSSTLYGVYKTFCEEAGERYDSANKFAMQMEEKGFEKKKRKAGNFWLGIKVVEAQGFEEVSQPYSDVIVLKKSGVVDG